MDGPFIHFSKMSVYWNVAGSSGCLSTLPAHIETGDWWQLALEELRTGRSSSDENSSSHRFLHSLSVSLQPPLDTMLNIITSFVYLGSQLTFIPFSYWLYQNSPHFIALTFLGYSFSKKSCWTCGRLAAYVVMEQSNCVNILSTAELYVLCHPADMEM